MRQLRPHETGVWNPVLTLSKEESGKRKESGHSLRRRLHAWWEGYDLPSAAAGSRSADPAREVASRAPDGTETPPASRDEWSGARQELVQMLWGAGFSVPGEPEYILELVKPFGLTSANTMLEFGAGMGGGARTVAGKIGCYVDAFEMNAALVQKARDLAIVEDIDKKAVFKPYDAPALELKKKYYDAGLIRETLMLIEDKAHFLETVVGALKPNTSIVIADFFISSAEPGDAATDSIASENRTLFPCGADMVADLLTEFGIELRINADETDRYVSMVKAAWNNVAARIAEEPQDSAVMEVLKQEIDFWALRNLAFESGEIRMRRMVGFKKTAIA